ncbi:hypothetical protein TNCV_4366031 [Trichonephila clavipes]|nr:hypothetical protein TNCV_4366031 [Trichonephila clavipes]
MKPFLCKGNTSDFLFPKINYSSATSFKSFLEAVRNIQLTHNMSENADNMFGWSVDGDERYEQNHNTFL